MTGRASTRDPRAMTRRGMTLVELLVTMVIVAIIGASLTRLMIVQSRYFDYQAVGRESRQTARGGLNMMLAELRMVEMPSGLADATAKRLTARIPYAFGLHCATSGGSSTLSIAPVDSAMFAEAGISGIARRDSTGVYLYAEGATTVGAGSAATCTAASITTLSGGRVITVSPALPAGTKVGALVFLFKRVTYEFKSSVTLPGRVALWRTIVSSGATEELVAPFGTTAGFRYFTLSSDVADASPPASLPAVQGVELHLNAESERPSRGTTAPRRAQRSTAVFFMNRIQ